MKEKMTSFIVIHWLSFEIRFVPGSTWSTGIAPAHDRRPLSSREAGSRRDRSLGHAAPPSCFTSFGNEASVGVSWLCELLLDFLNEFEMVCSGCKKYDEICRAAVHTLPKRTVFACFRLVLLKGRGLQCEPFLLDIASRCRLKHAEQKIQRALEKHRSDIEMRYTGEAASLLSFSRICFPLCIDLYAYLFAVCIIFKCWSCCS